MRPNRIDVFFYGLFMDAEVLHRAGVKPSNFRRAWVDDFALRIGKRATLVPGPGARVYGMVVALTQVELDRLYSAPGLEGYRPEEVLACSFDGEAISAVCYTLAKAPDSGERNPDYAKRLRGVIENLGFPPEYVESVQ